MPKRSASAKVRQLLSIHVGINDYPGSELDLAGCVNDSRILSDLAERFDFQPTVLNDADATKANIREAIRGAVSKLKGKDTLFLTMSSHGTQVPDQNGDEPDGADEAWCPYDIMSGQYYTDDELNEDLNKRSSQQVKIVILSDSCHSGTMTRMMQPLDETLDTGEDTDRVRRVRFMPPSIFLTKSQLASMVKAPRERTMSRSQTRVASSPGRHAGLLFSGCADHEYSYDAWFGNEPNGACSKCFVDSFMDLGGPEDVRKLPYTALYKALRSRLPSVDYPQTPNLYGTSAMQKWKIFT